MARREAGAAVSAGEFIARSEIAANLARHSRGIDRNEAGLIASAYHPDSTVAYGFFEGAAAEFAAILGAAMAGTPVTFHRTSPPYVEVDGDLARSESCVVAYARDEGPGGGTQRLIGGRYLDAHACRDGAWRITHRTYVLEWNMNWPSREAVLPGAILGGHRDADRSVSELRRFREEQGQGETDLAKSELETALARQALHDLVVIYCRAVDRGDAALLATVFHPDAFVVTGVLDANGPDYAAGIVDIVRANLASSFHSVANEYFEVAGDRAFGETYVIAHAVSAAEPVTETLTGGRYLDRFERRDGRWKIAHRTFVYDWSFSQPSSAETGGMYEMLKLRGGWAPNDPAVAFWADAQVGGA